jgi:transcriptional regulator with XRE-family HTH domain
MGGVTLLVDKIKDLCVKKRTSIKQLEEDANIGRNTIYRWDKSAPAADKLKRVADLLSVTVDELLKEA